MQLIISREHFINMALLLGNMHDFVSAVDIDFARELTT